MRTKLVESRQVIHHFLKLASWRIRKYDLFYEIFKFLGNVSKYIFREIHNGLLRIVKSKYFAKQVIFSKSPPGKFENDISLFCFLRVWFSCIKIFKHGPKIHSFRKSKYLRKI